MSGLFDAPHRTLAKMASATRVPITSGDLMQARVGFGMSHVFGSIDHTHLLRLAVPVIRPPRTPSGVPRARTEPYVSPRSPDRALAELVGVAQPGRALRGCGCVSFGVA